jgi:hypothetical protein
MKLIVIATPSVDLFVRQSPEKRTTNPCGIH